MFLPHGVARRPLWSMTGMGQRGTKGSKMPMCSSAVMTSLPRANGVYAISKSVEAVINRATELMYREFLTIILFTNYRIHELKI
jgi:hypothetical protein